MSLVKKLFGMAGMGDDRPKLQEGMACLAAGTGREGGHGGGRETGAKGGREA